MTFARHRGRRAALTLLGVGIGCAWELLVVVAQSTVTPDRVGVATAGNGFVLELGVLAGTAGVGAGYSARVVSALTDQNLGAWTAGTLTPRRLAELPASVADAVRSAYTEALTPVLGALVPLAAAAAVRLLFLRRVPLTGLGHPEARP